MYSLLWLFLVYGFLGWAMGTMLATLRRKTFIDVGFLFGPYCPAYGFTGVLFAIFLTELKGNLFFLGLGGAILSFLVTSLTGMFLEKLFHWKWWDYSRKRFQFAGYVNLPYTIVWGLGAIFCIEFLNPLTMRLYRMIPDFPRRILILALLVLVLLDFAATLLSAGKIRLQLRNFHTLSDLSENLQKAADTMGEGLSGWTLRHWEKAYPALERRQIIKERVEAERLWLNQVDREKEDAGIFGAGCSFYKLVCLFFLGAFLGDITETIFCYVTSGVIMSRSSVVYGPFSIVWGLGCMLLTLFLYQYRNRSDGFIFLFGTVLGGAYEYICSVVTEICFGTVFWDYSHIPFNLGGRINLLYCFFWGIAAVVWMKFLYPFLSKWIEKIPKTFGTWMCRGLLVFMTINVIISALALGQYSLRSSGEPYEATTLTEILDERFPDERMERIYPNAIMTK